MAKNARHRLPSAVFKRMSRDDLKKAKVMRKLADRLRLITANLVNNECALNAFDAGPLGAAGSGIDASEIDMDLLHEFVHEAQVALEVADKCLNKATDYLEYVAATAANNAYCDYVAAAK